MIANHSCARLSELDLAYSQYVPPGGNWKHIPESVPSMRIKQIRESYARGEGSRSTYYGRLHPDEPSYTINTYYTRPGNGCHLHYDVSQLRTLSHREAARLQSFPDDFVLAGPATAVARQIGNAVPPLLAFQIANNFGQPGSAIDLFSGCGGLGLGFKWAGWKTVVANDIDAHALETHSRNIAGPTVLGDIRSIDVLDRVAHAANTARRPLVVLGGPPCQGFSTAGNARTLDDERNHLFECYVRVLGRARPDAFVFENVPGIQSIDGGRFFPRIVEALRNTGYDTAIWKLRAELYGVPQRRTRVFLVGAPRGKPVPRAPAPSTKFGVSTDLLGRETDAPGVRAALSDLPALKHGQDGQLLDYAHAPATLYQEFCRGAIAPGVYMHRLRSTP